MFIEKLTKKEIIDFFDKEIYTDWLDNWKEKGLENMFLSLGYDSSNIRNYKQTDKAIKFNIHDVSFTATDFDMVNSRTVRFKHNMHNEKWLKYMYSKFGNQYAEAFKKYREMKKEYALKNFENEFNCQTKEYCQAFNKTDLSK